MNRFIIGGFSIVFLDCLDCVEILCFQHERAILIFFVSTSNNIQVKRKLCSLTIPSRPVNLWGIRGIRRLSSGETGFLGISDGLLFCQYLVLIELTRLSVIFFHDWQ